MENLLNDISEIVKKVIEKILPKKIEQVPIGVSNRHIHLSKKDLELLFGKGYQLNNLKNLKQPNQFAAKEIVTIVGSKGTIHNVRILGPARKMTQVEISKTDCFLLGINAPVRNSGDIKDTPGITIVGPKNTITIKEGVIIASNHLHLSENEAKELSLNDGDKIVIRCINKHRKIYFSDVLVRSGKAHLKEFHIDTDEANAGFLSSGDMVDIIF